jgi:hypothetical protein
MIVTRAKFKLTSRKQFADFTAETLTFSVSYDKANCPEDLHFAKFTPTGSIEMYVDNPVVLEKLKLGQTYYVDFTEA